MARRWQEDVVSRRCGGLRSVSIAQRRYMTCTTTRMFLSQEITSGRCEQSRQSDEWTVSYESSRLVLRDLRKHRRTQRSHGIKRDETVLKMRAPGEELAGDDERRRRSLDFEVKKEARTTKRKPQSVQIMNQFISEELVFYIVSLHRYQV